MGRRKRSPEPEEEAEVPMSPLIDCVFLLLIFFLVTTVIKRKEKLIPIQLPDMSSSVAVEAIDKSVVLGLGIHGKIYEGLKAKNTKAEVGDTMEYIPIPSIDLWLESKLKAEGESLLKRPLRIDADRDVVFQEAVDLIDKLKLKGFSDVGIKTRQRASRL